MMPISLSRKDFLKCLGAGTAWAVFPVAPWLANKPQDLQPRSHGIKIKDMARDAAALFVASRRNVVHADLDALVVHGLDPVIGGMRCSGGQITMPETPGLGLDIDPAFVKSLRRPA
ncbi:MAG: hypothetical protein ABFD80_12685 [Acidobacteriota bacterium]